MNKIPQLSTLALEFFCELIKSRSHKKTAANLGLSPSKASRLLNELRREFQDELFIKMGAQMLPTQRAQSIYPTIQDTISALRSIAQKEVFAPENCNKTFRIAATDNAIPNFFNFAMPLFYAAAPNAGLEIVPIRSNLLHDIKSGLCDFAIFPWRNVFNSLCRAPLFRKSYAILLPLTHPLVDVYNNKGRLRQEDLLQFKQIKTSFDLPSATGRTIDGYALGRSTLARSAAAVTTPYFLSVPTLLRCSNYYAVMTERTANEYSHLYGDLTTLPMPEGSAVRGRITMLLWDARTEQDPAYVWLRELFLSVSRERKMLE